MKAINKTESKINKEYGGYLPLELVTINGEFFDNHRFTVRRYNAGRTAIYMALKDMNVNTVWLPIYLCSSVRDFLIQKNIHIKYYNIDKQFLPLNIVQEDNEAVVWTNWYGTINRGNIEYITQNYFNLILDNTQAFYTPPQKMVYNVYSPRKFFGISDGAYLIKGDFLLDDVYLQPSDTISSIEYLLKSLNTSTNEAYEEFLRNEKRIESEDVMSMSTITRKLLSAMDYQNIRNVRIRNFLCIHKYLSDVNEFYISSEIFDDEWLVPMVYPFLYRSEKLRNKLISSRIYVSQWWKTVIGNALSNDWEKYLSEYMIPLPIDQRYDENDMRDIANVVLESL